MRYLLDTNIISNLMRRPRGSVAMRVEALGAEAMLTSVIVAAELRFGVRRSGSEALARRLDEALEALPVMSFETPADAVYAEVRAQLERQGTPIGGNDLLIAAHAKALGTCLVTDNMQEFSRVPNLQLENWLRD
jgi:tRNA(fMet)-specific endonuclease VapC